jgi:hypothetical protein
VQGAGTLASTNHVRKIKNGQPIIGTAVTEFIVKPTMAGTITMTITTKNPTSLTPVIKKYTIEVK